MVGNRIEYAPPPLPKDLLCDLLLAKYPGHRTSQQLLKELVDEYIKLWHLIQQYRYYRIVAPGPLIGVFDVHRGFTSFFDDCVSYLRHYLTLEEVTWKGKTDVYGAVHTVEAYREEYHRDPPPMWNDMTAIAGAGKRLKFSIVH